MFLQVPSKIILCPTLQEILTLQLLSWVGDDIRAVTSSVWRSPNFFCLWKASISIFIYMPLPFLVDSQNTGSNPRADVGAWEELDILGECVVRTTFCWWRNKSRGISSPGALHSATLDLTPGFATFLFAPEKWKWQYLVCPHMCQLILALVIIPLLPWHRATHSH